MVESVITDVKVTLRYEKGSFSYSDLKPEATNAQAFQIGSAINSLQTEPAAGIFKVVTTELLEVD
jgi:hypothetical protein